LKTIEFNINEDIIVKKIVSHDIDLFFQFTRNRNNKYCIDFLSESVCDFFELNATEIKLDPSLIFNERIFSDDKKNTLESLDLAIENNILWKCEFRINLPNNGIIWVKVTANIEKTIDDSISVFGKMVNITKIKNAELLHKSFEDRNQFANMASGVGVWDWDLVTNKVFYSEESLKILEINEDDTSIIDCPENWDDNVHVDDRAVYYGNINLHFEGKIPYYETYHRLLCNGKYKWILDRGKVISRDKEGKPTRIVGTHNDVSLLKEKEQNLIENLELLNKQKNQLLNFAHIVSHNLRTHTGNLASILSMEANKILDKDETLQHLKTVSDDLTNTLENLIELVEIQTENDKIKEDLNVNNFLLKTFKLLTDDLTNLNINIDNQIPKNLIINFIPAYLESILLNLTTNAIKYSKPNHQISISYSFEKIDDFNVIIVKDNGLGIDLEKYKDSIFGMYKTFHNNDDATGIGLYITKNQLESLGGKIEVESQVGVGTTFKVFIK
jgi:PAS domain-containing protein